jgi:hypothetical protein
VVQVEKSIATTTLTAFDSIPKIDSACFCAGTTPEIRKTALNQYKDSKFDQDLLKIYGSSCAAWDDMAGTPYKEYCPADLDTCSQGGNWCRQNWCFVNDPVACAARGFDVAGGSVFSPSSGETTTYYSFGICGVADCYNNEDNWVKGVCPFGLTLEEKAECKRKLKQPAGGSTILNDAMNADIVAGGFRSEQACLCRAGSFYTERTNSTYDVCQACPEGANCGEKGVDRDGLTLQEILPLPGWWRAGPNSTIFLDCTKLYENLGEDTSRMLARERCCPFCNLTSNQLVGNTTSNATSFTNLTSTPCLKGYTGPLCFACDTSVNYVWSGSDCIYCNGGASLSAHIGMWFVIGLSVSFVVFLVFVLVKQPKNKAASKKRDTLWNNAKVLRSWGQLFSATPSTFDLDWGESL